MKFSREGPSIEGSACVFHSFHSFIHRGEVIVTIEHWAVLPDS